MDKYYYDYQGSQPPKRSRGSYSTDPRNQKFTRNDYTQESIREQPKAPVGQNFAQDGNRFVGTESQFQMNSTSLPAITNVPSIPKTTTLTDFYQYPNTSASQPVYSGSLNAGTVFGREQMAVSFHKESANSALIHPQAYNTFAIQSSNNNHQQRIASRPENAIGSLEYHNRDTLSTVAPSLAPRSGSYVFNNAIAERTGVVDSSLAPSTVLTPDQRISSNPPRELCTGILVEKSPTSRVESLNQYQYVSPFSSAAKQESYLPSNNLHPEAADTISDVYRKEPSSFKQTLAPNLTGNPSSSYLDEIFRRKQSSNFTATEGSRLPTTSMPSPIRNPATYQREIPPHNNTFSSPVENQVGSITSHDKLHHRTNFNVNPAFSDLAAKQLQPSNSMLPDFQVTKPNTFQDVSLNNSMSLEGNISAVRNSQNTQQNIFPNEPVRLPQANENQAHQRFISPPNVIKPTSSGIQLVPTSFTTLSTPIQEYAAPSIKMSEHSRPSVPSEQPSTLKTESVQDVASFLKQASGQGVYNLSEENADPSWFFLGNNNATSHPPESKRLKSLDVPIINPSKSGHHNIGPSSSASVSSTSQGTKSPFTNEVKQETPLKAKFSAITEPSSTSVSGTSTSSTVGLNDHEGSFKPSEKASNVNSEPRATSIIAVAVDRPKIENVLGPEYIVAPPPHSMYDRDKLVTDGVELWIRYAGDESVTKFSAQLKELISSQYPSDRKFLLEHVIAVWLTWEPEKFRLILEPLSSMVKKRKRIYNKRASPFYALVQLFNPTTERVNSIFDPTAELQADYSIDVKCPNLCQNILQYLTEENTNDHLVTWIIDCLSITSPLVQKRYFKWLIEKIDWDNASSNGAENPDEVNYMHQLLSLLKDDKSKSAIASALVSVFFTSWENREALFKSQELRPTLVNYFNNPGSIAAQNQLYILLADEPESFKFAVVLELLNALKEHSESGSIKWFYNLILPVMIDVIVEKDRSLAAHLFETLVSDEKWFSFLFFKSKDVEIKHQELCSLETISQVDINRGLLQLVQAITQLEQYNIQSRISDMWLQQWKRNKIDRLWILALITLYPQSPKALQEMIVQLIQCTLDQEIDIENSDCPIWCDLLDMFLLNKIPGLSSLFEAAFNMFFNNDKIRDQVHVRFEQCLTKLSECFVAEVANKTKSHGKKSKKKKQKWSSSAHTVSQPVCEFVGLLHSYLSLHRTVAAAQALAKRILDSSCCISLIKFLSPSPLPQIRSHTVATLALLTTIASEDTFLADCWVKTWEAQDLRNLVSLLADPDDLIAEKAQSFIEQLLSLKVDVSAISNKIKHELNRDCRSSSDKINRLSAQPDQIGALGPLRIILARQQTILRLIQEQSSRISEISTAV